MNNLEPLSKDQEQRMHSILDEQIYSLTNAIKIKQPSEYSSGAGLPLSKTYDSPPTASYNYSNTKLRVVDHDRLPSPKIPDTLQSKKENYNPLDADRSLAHRWSSIQKNTSFKGQPTADYTHI